MLKKHNKKRMHHGWRSQVYCLFSDTTYRPCLWSFSCGVDLILGALTHQQVIPPEMGCFLLIIVSRNYPFFRILPICEIQTFREKST